MMRRSWRSAFYVAAGAALMVALLAAPGVWATPGQDMINQTVPTATPSSQPATPQPQPNTPVPTTDPGAPTAVVPTGTVTATATVATQASPLGLTIIADRQQVWPGATVTFTLTVTNRGATPLEQVTIADVLANGLEPGEVVSGEATWDGTTLRATAPSLAAGAKFIVVYTARVTATAPGQAIVTRATASASGGATATASLTLGMPPTELPITGGSLAP